MIGQRLPDGEPTPWPPPNGSYWRAPLRVGDPSELWGWYVMTPNGLYGCLANHDVDVHEDGSISSWPSILITAGHSGLSYHGYLEHGIWREC